MFCSLVDRKFISLQETVLYDKENLARFSQETVLYHKENLARFLQEFVLYHKNFARSCKK